MDPIWVIVGPGYVLNQPNFRRLGTSTLARFSMAIHLSHKTSIALWDSRDKVLQLPLRDEVKQDGFLGEPVSLQMDVSENMVFYPQIIH